RLFEAHAPGVDDQGREAFLARVVDARADGAQRVDQVADRPLVHARDAREPVFAAAERERRGERPERGAGIAEKKLCVFHRERAAHATHLLSGKLRAQFLQRLAHHPRVVGVEEARDLGLAFGERREEQHAVGDALRAGQAHRAARAARGLQLEDFSHCSRAARASAKSFSSAAGSSSSALTSSIFFENREISRNSWSLFAAQMSRHISGWLEAMRVKSRKPPAANEKSCSALPRFAMSCTSANASRCGRWLTAASTASCSSAGISLTCAPHACHASATVRTLSREFSSRGVMTTRRCWNS